MCNLLGVSALHPVTLETSFQALRSHAYPAMPDGWGAVFYEKNDAYVFREPRPACDSRLADLLARSGVESKLVLSHIRKATGGDIELRNTHPFTREVNGRLHSFAFNGDVPDVFNIKLATNRFLPMGNTDGEYAFCWLLQQLASENTDNDWTRTASILEALGRQLSDNGPANFLYSDSIRLYAFASRRRHPDGEYPPGLYHLSRHCNHEKSVLPEIGLQVQSSQMAEQSETAQSLVLLASIPLSDEAWIPFAENQLLVVEKGRILNTYSETATSMAGQ
jgi:glutamine amidotransferase